MYKISGKLSVSILVMFMGLFSFSSMAKASCSNPVLDDECSFKGYSYSVAGVPDVVDITATCKRVLDDFYIFVANNVLTENRITDTKINNIVNALTTSTPDTKYSGGIYTEIKDLFVSVPDYDEDGHIWIVIHDIYSSGADGTDITAYFREIDLQYKYNNPVEGSNGHEIIFLSPNQVDSTKRLSDLSYQLVDMIHYGRKITLNEDKWVRDVIARQFPILLGYTDYLDDIEDFSKSPSSSLTGNVINEDYTKVYPGATALFGKYITEKYSPYFLEYWSNSSTTGIAGFNSTISLYESDISFCDIFHNWVISNNVNRGDYNYTSYDPPPFSNYSISTFPHSVSQKLDSYSASYVGVKTDNIDSEDKLQLTMEFPEVADVRLSIAKYSTTDTNAFELNHETIMADEATVVSFDDFHDTYNRILVILSRCSQSESLQYKVEAELISPQEDGDDDLEEDGDSLEDGDSGDTDGDTDTAIDGDTENDTTDQEAAEDIIYGTKTCSEINNCQNRCSTNACITECISEGTNEAQSQWNNFYTCMTGDFDGGLNCLNIADLDTRNACITGQCPGELYESCKLTSGSVITKDDVGGSNCNNIPQKNYPAVLVILLFVVMFIIRRSKIIA